MPLLRIKADDEFKLEECHQEAFEGIKQYLSSPPILIPPRKRKEFEALHFDLRAFDWKHVSPR